MILLIVAGIFFARNLLIPISADDYVYRFIWNAETFHGKSNDWIPIESLGDIFNSQIEHYLHWGGRSIAHFFVQFFMWQGKIYFDFANTIIFVIFVILILKLAKSRKFLYALIGLWIALPQFVPTMLWLTGSCNYLWMTTLQIGFLFALTENRKIMIPLGIFAGWSNEAGAISILILSLIHLRTKKEPIECREILGLISFSIGLILLIFAPGNFERGGSIGSHFIDNFQSFATIIFNSLPLIVLCLMNLKSRVKIFLFGGFIAPTALLFSPEFPTRAAFISPVLFLIGALISLEDIKNFIVRLSFGIASIFCAWTLILSLYADFEIHRQHSSRQISEEVSTIHGFPILEKFLGERIVTQQILDNDPTSNENHEYNRAMAQFFSLEKIRRIE